MAAVRGPPSAHGETLGHGALAPKGMHSNLFVDSPLPRLTVPEACDGRRPSTAARKARAVVRATNDALDALDFMNGNGWKPQTGIRSCILHEAPPELRQVHAKVESTDFDQIGEEAALASLLRGRGGDYQCSDPTQGSLASFNIHALSLPETTAGAPLVHDLLEGDPTAQQQLNEPQRLLRDIGDEQRLIDEHGDIHPYVDPVLKSSRRHYVAFCRKMLSAELCRPSFSMKETVGVFFVWKKGRQKMGDFGCPENQPPLLAQPVGVTDDSRRLCGHWH